jgi:hypothetical protein
MDELGLTGDGIDYVYPGVSCITIMVNLLVIVGQVGIVLLMVSPIVIAGLVWIVLIVGSFMVMVALVGFVLLVVSPMVMVTLVGILFLVKGACHCSPLLRALVVNWLMDRRPARGWPSMAMAMARTIKNQEIFYYESCF